MNAGLSRLADVARENSGGPDYYPVKRRGQQRRLDPNWLAIAWLEAQTLDDTEEAARYEVVGTDGQLTGIRYAGWNRAFNERTHHARPIFQLLNDKLFSAFPVTSPCPDCQNLAYTRPCPEHGDPAKYQNKPSLPGRAESLLGHMYIRLTAAVEAMDLPEEIAFTHQPPRHPDYSPSAFTYQPARSTIRGILGNGNTL